MPIFRKRKTVEPKKKGLPIAQLGQEFEFTDERLKIGLEAYPTYKRLISNARLDMVLALGLYYDDVSQKWQPLSAIDISTVRNQGRYYAAEPAALTVDQWNNMRIDEKQRVITFDYPSHSLAEGMEFDMDTAISPPVDWYPVSTDYFFDSMTLAFYDIVGSNNFLDITFVYPDASEFPFLSLSGIAADVMRFDKMVAWKSMHFRANSTGGDSFKIKILLHKRHKYYP